jgi:hypothetical protein
MKKTALFAAILLIMILLFPARNARAETIPEKYPRLFAALAALKPGDVVNLADLAIRLDYREDHTYNEPGSYYLLHPRDLDIRATDDPPYAHEFPHLHLNLPLMPENSPTTHLIISDQPESIKEENHYFEDTGWGTDGLYGKATAPAGKRVRLLVDHYNQSKKTKWLKVFMTAREQTTVNIHKKGSSVADNSIVAGSLADQISHQVNVADVREIPADRPVPLGQWGPLHPEDTAVLLYEMTPLKDISFWTVITDEDGLASPSMADLESLPKLKSLKWKDREEKLRGLVKRERFPSRYARALESFIHARGIFLYPDRVCRSSYDFAGNGRWIQAYSAFEYTEGMDELTADGAPVRTNNRGNYGGYIRMNIRLSSLPEGANTVAVVMVNTSDTLGGMVKTTLDRKTGTSFVFSKASMTNDVISQKKAVLLWKGEARPGSDIDIQFFSLANASVRPWYLIIPLP